MQRSTSKRSFFLRAAIALLASTFSVTGGATLIGDSANVRLKSPNGTIVDSTAIDLADSVVISNGVEIQAGDGSNVGDFLLTGADALGNSVDEQIDIRASSIFLRILSGFEDQSVPAKKLTGYAGSAQYILSGLDFAGGTLLGVSFSSDGIANLSALGSSWIALTDPHTITIALDKIEFVDRDASDYAEITINLRTSTNPNPLPEPTGLALMAVASLAFFRTRWKHQAV